MLADLADDPRPNGVTKMAGAKDRYRIRTGDYRIVYQISDDIRWMEVIGIRHRQVVYRHFTLLLLLLRSHR